MVLWIPRHQDSAHPVAVAVQVLGGRVRHDVGAEFQRPLEVGGHEGVVHHHQGAGRMGGFGKGLQIGDPEHGIRGRLEEQHRRSRVQLPDGGFGVTRVHPGEVEPPGAQHVLADAVGAAVAVARGDHPAAARDQIERHHDRRHSRRAGDGADAPLEGRQVGFHRVPRGIPGPRVLVVPRLARRLLHEGRRLDQGNDDGPAAGVGMLPGVDGAGGEAPGGVPVGSGSGARILPEVATQGPWRKRPHEPRGYPAYPPGGWWVPGASPRVVAPIATRFARGGDTPPRTPPPRRCAPRRRVLIHTD